MTPRHGEIWLVDMGMAAKTRPTVVLIADNLDARVSKAITVNPDFGCVEWPGGVDLCPDAMRQAMTGSESEAEFHSTTALRKEPKRNQ